MGGRKEKSLERKENTEGGRERGGERERDREKERKRDGKILST